MKTMGYFFIGLLMLPTFLNAAGLTPGTTMQEIQTFIDPDPPASTLPKLVLPPEPPPNVRLPEVIATTHDWRGVQCAVVEPRFAIFHQASKWTAFWEKGMAPYSAKFAQVPTIDFSRDMVVGVFLGEKPTPYFEVEIRSAMIEESADHQKRLVVRYRTISKMQGVFTPPFAIQPFHLKRLPTFEGPVEFKRARR